jgi:hypothetical protein
MNKVIVIHELNRHDIKQLKQLISSATLKFRVPYASNTTEIVRPEVIAISNCLTRADFKECRHVIEIIDLTPEWNPNEEL